MWMIALATKSPKEEAKGVPPLTPRLPFVESGTQPMDATSQCVATNIAALTVTPPPTEVATAHALAFSPTSVPSHFGQTLPGHDNCSNTEMHTHTGQETVDSSRKTDQPLTLHHQTTPTAKVSLNISSNLLYPPNHRIIHFLTHSSLISRPLMILHYLLT